MPGVVPKRTAERRRRNKTGVTQAKSRVQKVEQPAADEDWHPLARDWYISLGRSGQVQFYEPSDWQQARVWAEVLSRALNAPRLSSTLIGQWSSGAEELLTTEGARRRMRLELERAPESDPTVRVLDDYRQIVGG